MFSARASPCSARVSRPRRPQVCPRLGGHFLTNSTQNDGAQRSLNPPAGLPFWRTATRRRLRKSDTHDHIIPLYTSLIKVSSPQQPFFVPARRAADLPGGF